MFSGQTGSWLHHIQLVSTCLLATMPLTVARSLARSLRRVFGLQEAGGFVFGVKSAAAAPPAISRQGVLTTPKIDASYLAQAQAQSLPKLFHMTN